MMMIMMTIIIIILIIIIIIIIIICKIFTVARNENLILLEFEFISNYTPVQHTT
jgi:hypothetical protein